MLSDLSHLFAIYHNVFVINRVVISLFDRVQRNTIKWAGVTRPAQEPVFPNRRPEALRVTFRLAVQQLRPKVDFVGPVLLPR